MKTLIYLCKAYRAYFKTPKGRHDLIDFARAGIAILLSIAAVLLFVRQICEK